MFAVVAAVSLAAGPIATAGSNDYPDWPTTQFNHRGENVRAIQYLLTYNGYTTTADGVFGSGTKSKVQSFQASRGLSADGIVGGGTWSVLTPTVYLGESNYAVRAVQSLLNAKRDPNNPHWAHLTVDGVFGSGTRQAVKDFQTHEGLTSDGVVGPTTWEHLAWHYVLMRPDSYNCAAGGQTVQPDSESWGTAATIAAIQRAGYYFNSQGVGDLPYWDFSHEHGTAFPPDVHASHDRGMDVDVGIITKNPHDQCTSGRGVVYTNTSRYDQLKTKELVWDIRAGAAFSSIQNIKLVYYNDPAFLTWFPTIVNPNGGPSHDHHLHVRYCTAAHYDADYSGVAADWRNAGS